MVILSKNKCNIVPFDKLVRIDINPGYVSNKEGTINTKDMKYFIRGHLVDNESDVARVTLGIYDTEEIAIHVMEMMMKFYETNPNGVYRMP